MAKIRHIAYRANDVEAMANFFVEALDMTITQRRTNKAIDLSDGTINITVLPVRAGAGDEPERQGIDHIGFSVADDEEAGARLESAGAIKLGSLPLGSSAHYELKFRGPEGIVVDLGNWVGTAPIEEVSSKSRRTDGDV